MSRIANNPVTVGSGIEVSLKGQAFSAKGPKGLLSYDIHPAVDVHFADNVLTFKAKAGVDNVDAHVGTTRALIYNIVHGVSQGFEKALKLIGVGFRAQVQAKVLNLTLGFSHPVKFAIPDGITIETPSQTDIVIKGIDKQLVGQVAANIRAYRPPEPYKGKGIRYVDEYVARKEGKKK